MANATNYSPDAWQNLPKASFRGVEFYLPSAAIPTGRRNIAHKFALQRLPGYESLTLEDGPIRLAAQLFGQDQADLLRQRDQLLAALSRPTAGRLVLPWIPATQAITISLPVWRYEGLSNNHLAVQLEFLPVANVDYQSSATAAKAQLQAQAKASLKQSKSSFLNAFNTDNVADYIRQSAADHGGLLADAVSQVKNVNAALSSADLDQVIFTLRNQIAVSNGLEFIDQIGRLYINLATIAESPRQALNLLRPLYNLNAYATGARVSTPSRQTQAQNHQAISLAAATACLASAANAATAAQFDSHQDAIEQRDALLQGIENLLDQASGEQAQSLNNLYSAAHQSLSQTANGLGRIISHTVITDTSAVALSQGLYQSGAMADDIVARNPCISHPAFISAGTQLEIIINAQ